jgi:hypothetical protein
MASWLAGKILSVVMMALQDRRITKPEVVLEYWKCG